MKKIYLLLTLFVLVTLGVKAQSDFTLTAEGVEIQDTLKIEISEAGENPRYDFIHITNNTESDKSIKIQLEYIELATDAVLQMCFAGQCQDVLISPAVTLSPNVEYTDFDLMYMYQNTNYSLAKVSILDAATETPLKSFFAFYKDPSNISLGKQIKQSNVLSLEAYPNPANNNATISYNLPSNYNSGKIIIRNMIGKEVKTIAINGGSNSKMTISTSDMPNGVYFYSIIGDGKPLSTKKLIVKH
jgi:hypothetical protein